MATHREVQFNSQYAMFLRKHYVALFCYVCLEDFKEGEMIVSTAASNRTKVRHLNCWLKMWQGNEDVNLKAFLHSDQNPEDLHGRYRKFPEVSVPACPNCRSLKVWRGGIIQLKDHKMKQRWECGSCGHQFSGMIQEEKDANDGVTNLRCDNSLSMSPKTER